MATEHTNGEAHTTIRATYNSPNGSKVFTHSVTSPQPTDTGSKAAYINSLRSATKTLQDDINTFLTAKMEEDKEVAARNNASSNKSKTRDEEEEENYGEEKVEED